VERRHTVPCDEMLEYRGRSFKEVSEYIISNATIHALLISNSMLKIDFNAETTNAGITVI
jgi:hypothetical protein